MELQRSYIERDLSLGATSGTRTIDLPKSALLSELVLRFAMFNGANPNKFNYLHNTITKVEVIVNGSEVVKSLTGTELLGLAYLNSGVIPARYVDDEAYGFPWEALPIHFGRFSGDMEYGLNTGLVVNPQLKITWDTTRVGLTATSLYAIDSYPVLDLQAIQFIDAPGVFMKGFIKSHRYTRWSPTANSEKKRVEIPTIHKLRRLVVRVHDNAYLLENSLYHTYLDLNRGVRQPFKMDTEDWVALMKQKYEEVHVYGRISLDDTPKQYGFDMSHLHSFSGVGRTDGYLYACSGGSGGRLALRTSLISTDAPPAADVLHQFDAVGDIFLGMLVIPFDEPNDEFMLDTSKWTDVDLQLEAAASGIATILPTLDIIGEEVVVK